MEFIAAASGRSIGHAFERSLRALSQARFERLIPPAHIQLVQGPEAGALEAYLDQWRARLDAGEAIAWLEGYNAQGEARFKFFGKHSFRQL